MQTTGIIQGDCIEVLKNLPEKFVDCCVTSPPYFNLRDYGIGGQIGLEDTPEEYIEKLVHVFREVKRVLKDDGTLWVNIGDSYACNSNGGTKLQGNSEFNKNRPSRELTSLPKKSVPNSCKPKDLIGIPWMLAFALREDGWYLRQDIIWAKPNPMPESVKDRCTKSHEYLFLLSKSHKYFFDGSAIKEEAKWKKDNRYGMGRIEYSGKRTTEQGKQSKGQRGFVSISDMKNKRDVWNVSVQSISDSHFATFPEKLIEPCILAGSRVGGIVLDPFFGSGTTGRVAAKLNREYLGVELNPDYIEIAKRRVNDVQMSIEGFFGS